MFKTILTNLLSIHKPRVNYPVMVKIEIYKKTESNQDELVWWNFIDSYLLNLSAHNRTITINDIKIEAEIVE